MLALPHLLKKTRNRVFGFCLKVAILLNAVATLGGLVSTVAVAVPGPSSGMGGVLGAKRGVGHGGSPACWSGADHPLGARSLAPMHSRDRTRLGALGNHPGTNCGGHRGVLGMAAVQVWTVGTPCQESTPIAQYRKRRRSQALGGCRLRPGPLPSALGGPVPPFSVVLPVGVFRTHR